MCSFVLLVADFYNDNPKYSCYQYTLMSQGHDQVPSAQ